MSCCDRFMTPMIPNLTGTTRPHKISIASVPKMKKVCKKLGFSKNFCEEISLIYSETRHERKIEIFEAALKSKAAIRLI